MKRAQSVSTRSGSICKIQRGIFTLIMHFQMQKVDQDQDL